MGLNPSICEQQTSLNALGDPKRLPLCVAARMPPRYVSAVNDEQNVRTKCELSNFTHIEIFEGVRFTGTGRAQETTGQDPSTTS
jgi:hypothetical protein